MKMSLPEWNPQRRLPPMNKRNWVSIILVCLALAALFAGGCTSSTPPPSNHLVLTMSFDDDPDGYPYGSQVNVYILDEGRFRLEDIYGTFYGDYSWKSDSGKLTLDFDSYPAWSMTLAADGTFTGSEHGYDDGGSYEW
jgi:hypothetical protein